MSSILEKSFKQALSLCVQSYSKSSRNQNRGTVFILIYILYRYYCMNTSRWYFCFVIPSKGIFGNRVISTSKEQALLNGCSRGLHDIREGWSSIYCENSSWVAYQWVCRIWTKRSKIWTFIKLEDRVFFLQKPRVKFFNFFEYFSAIVFSSFSCGQRNRLL